MSPVQERVPPRNELGTAGKNQSKSKGAPEQEELSEEDQRLKDELDSLVESMNEPSKTENEYSQDLELMKRLIRDSTTSMTAVPKPLKFLMPHYELLTNLYERWISKYGESATFPKKLADVLSVIAMTHSDEAKNESLKYRLLSDDEAFTEWGHEYVRNLTLEIGNAYQENLGYDEAFIVKLVNLSMKIISFFLKNNGEADAVDLLLEIESIDRLPEFVHEHTYSRVAAYMVSCVPFLAPPDDVSLLRTAYSIYMAHGEYTQALTMAIKLDDEKMIRQVFETTDNEAIHKQLGLILSQQNLNISLPGYSDEVRECASNLKLHDYFEYLIKELNVSEPKVPEDIYKTHLENTRFGFGNSGSIDSAKQNLASAFVNALVNLGSGSDKLIQADDDNKSWIYKTKGRGMLSATASLGSIYQWNINDGLQNLDKYTYSSEDEVKAGALLGTGIVSANVHDDVEAALALLQEYVHDSKNRVLQTSAINGLGIAFAGTSNGEVLNLLLPLVSSEESIELSSLAALALGHVFVGTCNGDITSTILQTLLETDASSLNNKFVRFMSLGLGLLYIGKSEQVEDVLETIDAIDHSVASNLKVLVNICAFAGTGNVLQIQSLLQMCTPKTTDFVDEEKKLEESEEDHLKEGRNGEESSKRESEDVEMRDASSSGKETEKTKGIGEKTEKSAKEDEVSSEDEEGELYQGFAVLGIACIAMGESIGLDMSLRHFSHLMHYGNPLIKRTVPLAMGLVSCGNPQMKVFETLSRYSHDPDLDIAQNAIYSMGLVGAGTNNARLAQLLRQLASYYIKSADSLFMVRIAQGILHLGKGTLTLSPFNSERTILSKVSLASLLTVSVALMDPQLFILDDSNTQPSHELLYYLTTAVKPRMLVTVDEQLNPVKVNVRVGQAVDTVGQAGKPKTITGWVTQSTPVLLTHGERAELENTEEWTSLANSLEGVVILKKTPETMEVDA